MKFDRYKVLHNTMKKTRKICSIVITYVLCLTPRIGQNLVIKYIFCSRKCFRRLLKYMLVDVQKENFESFCLLCSGEMRTM